jgi:voltage-gated sodium channel
MAYFQAFARKLIGHAVFEVLIAVVIFLNAILVGVATYVTDDFVIEIIQHVCLLIFTVELFLRLAAAENFKSFIYNGWNVFDVFLVTLGYAGGLFVSGGGNMLTIRVLRILRVLRLLRIGSEIRLISAVLARSLRSLLFNGFFFMIFMYLFALLGTALFKLPEPEKLQGTELVAYNKLMAEAPPTPTCSPDPYGTLGEAMFTLFRVMTGEDWTDVRYNLLAAHKLNVIKPGPVAVNVFHIAWYSLSAFLLLNLLVGAIVNNYQVIMEEARRKKEGEREKQKTAS